MCKLIRSFYPNPAEVPAEVLDFIESNRHLEISLEEFRELHTNSTFSHNHTFENLFLYFHLERYLQKKRVVFYPNTCFIVDNRRHKFFINDLSEMLEFLDFSALKDPKIRKKFIFYSNTLQTVDKSQFTFGKSKELIYDLDYCLTKEGFMDRYKGDTMKQIKRRVYNRLQYPVKLIEEQQKEGLLRIEELTEDNLKDALSIHDRWVEWKQNNPDVFQMMFSSNRYNKCLEKVYGGEHEFLQKENFYSWVFYYENRPVAVRSFLKKGDRAYDTVWVSNYFDLPSNFVNALNTWCLMKGRELGVKFWNTGMAFEKKNSISKQHYPCSEHIIYSYKLV